MQTPPILEEVFYQNDLGRLHRSIPFKYLAAKIPGKSGRGRKPFLKKGWVNMMVDFAGKKQYYWIYPPVTY